MNRKKVIAMGAITAALALAGCAQGSGDGSGGSSGEGLSDGKVVIGVVTDMSAAYSALTGEGSVEGARLAIADYQEKYGDDAVATEIELIPVDHQNKPEIANTKVSELYDRNGADIILDVPSSAAALATAQHANSFQRLFIAVGAGTTELTGAQCNPYSYHWAYDTEMLARGSAAPITADGAKDWYIVYPDYAFGQDMTASFTEQIEANGGQVLATDPTPFPNDNFATFMTKALELKPDVIATMAAGTDLANFVKQYNEFGLRDQGIELAVGAMFDTDVESIGVEHLAGTLYATDWFWNLDDESRAWAERFEEARGTKPTAIHAGVYSAATQYLEAVQRAGTDSSDAVTAELDGYEFEDMFARNAVIRSEDHRMVHDAYLTQVKSPDEVQSPFDYTALLETIDGPDAFGAPSSACSM